MDVEHKYPLLIGHSIAGRKRLYNMQQVADFICIHGQYGDLTITQEDHSFFLNTIGIYIDRITDKEYLEELLKLLIPMQMEIDGTEEIDQEEIRTEMEMT